MNNIYQHYTIDLSSNNNFVQIPTVQGDGNNIRGFEVELIENGVQYNIDEDDCVVCIMGTKPDTSQIMNDCKLTDDGYILVDITSQMSAVKGRGDYQIVLMSKSTNSQLKSFPFHILTTPATFDVDHIISSDEFHLLTKGTTEANNAIKELNDNINEFNNYVNQAKESKEVATQKATEAANSAKFAKSSADRSKQEADKSSSSATASANSANTATQMANEATASATDAKVSETNAKDSEINAKDSENATKVSETAAKESEINAKASETAAKTSETNAKESEISAASSKTAAETYASTASTKASEAATSATSAEMSAETATSGATTASEKADSAIQSASTASEKATEADNYAKKAQSYTDGTGGVRPNEATDNAKYYYEQARDISTGLSGALIPIGTVAFSNLPALENVEKGWMYNISDKFTTTADFKEGAGHEIPMGANVYKTADGIWDILAGTPVSSVNGETGDVNITPEKIGAFPGLKIPSTTGGSFNDYVSSGIYYFTAATLPANKPPSVNNGWLVVIAAGSGTIKQVFMSFGEPDYYTFVRTKLNDDWSSWKRYAMSAELKPELIGALPVNGTAVNATKLDDKPASQFAQEVKYNTTTTNTYYKITFTPITEFMLNCLITIYQNYTPIIYNISGYYYKNIGKYWYNPTAQIVSAASRVSQREVRFGHNADGTLFVVVDGGMYTGINISNFTNGYLKLNDWGQKVIIEPINSLEGLNIDEVILARPPIVSNNVNRIEIVNALPSDAADHPNYIYIIPE